MNIEGLKYEFINNVNARREMFSTTVKDFFEIIMPSEGKCVIAVNGYGFEVNPDEFALIMPDEALRFVKAEPDTSVSVLKIYPYVVGVGTEIETNVKYFREKIATEKARVFSLPAAKWGLARDCMVRICLGEVSGNDGWQFAYLATMLFEIRAFGEPTGALESEPIYAEKEMPLFMETAALIADNLQSIDSLASLERLTGRKSFAVNRVFRKMTGTSTWNYILRKRLDLACMLILKGERATEAAARSGFKDYSVFYRLFMGTYGIAPTAVRKTGKVPMRLAEAAEATETVEAAEAEEAAETAKASETPAVQEAAEE
ncbi:MAG: helix-turn-helix transcriptional regulator [Clostridia bacterium]|nr:helix-turn-helix transcriptional regulator [Clostridia bacterium]